MADDQDNEAAIAPGSARKELNIAGKDWLNVSEAAFYCGVSESQFRKSALAYGLTPRKFMGKQLYEKAALYRAIAEAPNWHPAPRMAQGFATGYSEDPAVQDAYRRVACVCPYFRRDQDCGKGQDGPQDVGTVVAVGEPVSGRLGCSPHALPGRCEVAIQAHEHTRPTLTGRISGCHGRLLGRRLWKAGRVLAHPVPPLLSGFVASTLDPCFPPLSCGAHHA